MMVLQGELQVVSTPLELKEAQAASSASRVPKWQGSTSCQNPSAYAHALGLHLQLLQV